MSLVVQQQAIDLLKDDKAIDNAIKIFQGFGLAIFTAQALVALQWNLEHLVLERNSEGKYSIARVATSINAPDLRNRNLTPLVPPITRIAMELATSGGDLADEALRLATETVKTTRDAGVLGAIGKGLFGERRGLLEDIVGGTFKF